MKIKSWKFAVSILLAAGISSAGVVYPLGQTSTAGFNHGTVAGPTSRGWDFQVNATGVSVVQLGVNEFSNIPITLTLWDDASQTELAQIVVNAVASTWVFGDLATAVPLVSGHMYSVIGWADTTTSSVPWYLYSNTPPAAFNPTGTIQYVELRYDNAAGKDTFPLGTLAPPLQYGVTDIGYVVGGAGVPEPMSFMLAAGGIVLFYAARSRRSRRSL